MPRSKVFLACPRYGPVHFAAVQAAYEASKEAEVHLYPREDSRLPHNFNRLWCAALNTRQAQGWSHFAMLHADIAPAVGWLDVLLAEQARLGVQVVSAVVPIKDASGYTSTGVYNPQTGAIRRLSRREVAQQPVTFRSPQQGHPLVVNSGCWVCAFTEPWVEQVCFRFLDQIVEKDGVFEALTMPEDWDFSLQLDRLGVSVAATRLVTLTHYGTQGWPSLVHEGMAVREMGRREGVAPL